MSDSKITKLNKPVEAPLHDVLQRGARELLAKAVEAELNALLEQYSTLEVNDKKPLYVMVIYPREQYKPDWVAFR